MQTRVGSIPYTHALHYKLKIRTLPRIPVYNLSKRAQKPINMRSTFSKMSNAIFRQRGIEASYYRGGTSRGLIFHEPDLPKEASARRNLFLQAIGAPDPHGRQLNGMGAGISSLSKVCIVGDGSAHDADVTYTFAGIGIERDEVDFNGNCGNLASAIGPYSFEKRLIRKRDNQPDPYSQDGEVTVRIYNTNTGVMIRNTFRVASGEARVDDKTSIDGVSGLGIGVMLDFLRPGGSKTGRLLPTGNATDKISGYEVSCIDSANPCIFVRASDLGVDPTILPAQLNENTKVREILETIRAQGAIAMGICKDGSEVPRVIPKIALVSPPVDQKTLSGAVTPKSKLDLVVRFISDAQPHRAIPLTGALCTASAAKVPGSVVERCLPEKLTEYPVITIGHPSGRIQCNAVMDDGGNVECASVVRTARRIFEGQVFWSEEIL